MLAFSKPTEGKVQLPQFVRDEAFQDPFDVTKPEDIVDGEPVGEDAFWARVSAMQWFHISAGGGLTVNDVH